VPVARQGTPPCLRFRAKLYSLDASLIDLTLSLFPWAGYQATKGAIKLHVGLDHDGHLPAFVEITEGRCNEIHWARTLELPAGSMVVFDRGFTDCAWGKSLSEKNIRFVTRLKRRMPYTIQERRKVTWKENVTSDQTIRLKGSKAKAYDLVLRRIGYRDPETGQHLFFLTNDFDLAATTIAKLYRERWQIELFFKWIKQNLRIKSFFGRSRNAVLTQFWIAMIAYVLLAYLKFQLSLTWSLGHILRLFQLNLFDRRSLQELLQDRASPPDLPDLPAALAFS